MATASATFSPLELSMYLKSARKSSAMTERLFDCTLNWGEIEKLLCGGLSELTDTDSCSWRELT